MKVLVACEYTGVVRDAFARRGHEAWSCDLRESATDGDHYCGDVRDILMDGWDLMIAHPPCQYLSFAGNHAWNDPGRKEKRNEAMALFIALANACIPKVCIENPVGYPNQVYRKPDQIIHPYMFGDEQMKRTCLWLRGLPKLWWWPEDDLFGKQTATARPQPMYVGKNNYYYVDGNNPGDIRSRTFACIAQAMAEQWG